MTPVTHIEDVRLQRCLLDALAAMRSLQEAAAAAHAALADEGDIGFYRGLADTAASWQCDIGYALGQLRLPDGSSSVEISPPTPPVRRPGSTRIGG